MQELWNVWGYTSKQLRVLNSTCQSDQFGDIKQYFDFFHGYLIKALHFYFVFLIDQVYPRWGRGGGPLTPPPGLINNSFSLVLPVLTHV